MTHLLLHDCVHAPHRAGRQRSRPGSPEARLMILESSGRPQSLLLLVWQTPFDLLFKCCFISNLNLNSPLRILFIVHSLFLLPPPSPFSILLSSALPCSGTSPLHHRSSPSSLNWPLWSLYPPRLAPPLISVLSLLSSLYSLSSHLLLSSYFLTYLFPLFYLYIFYLLKCELTKNPRMETTRRRSCLTSGGSTSRSTALKETQSQVLQIKYMGWS